MSEYIKKVYKCNDCETIITIETSIHELPESIICPCDAVSESQAD